MATLPLVSPFTYPPTSSFALSVPPSHALSQSHLHALSHTHTHTPTLSSSMTLLWASVVNMFLSRSLSGAAPSSTIPQCSHPQRKQQRPQLSAPAAPRRAGGTAPWKRSPWVTTSMQGRPRHATGQLGGRRGADYVCARAPLLPPGIQRIHPRTKDPTQKGHLAVPGGAQCPKQRDHLRREGPRQGPGTSALPKRRCPNGKAARLLSEPDCRWASTQRTRIRRTLLHLPHLPGVRGPQLEAR